MWSEAIVGAVEFVSKSHVLRDYSTARERHRDRDDRQKDRETDRDRERRILLIN